MRQKYVDRKHVKKAGMAEKLEEVRDEDRTTLLPVPQVDTHLLRLLPPVAQHPCSPPTPTPCQLMIQYVLADDIVGVFRCLIQGANPNVCAVAASSSTALHFAAAGGQRCV